MPVNVEGRRAWQRRRYAERRDEMRAIAAARRTPEFLAAMRDYMARYRAAHPDRVKDAELRRKFRLTYAGYVALHEAQGGLCAICGRPETRRHHSGTLHGLAVDHDHATGRVRGLLCSECNFALGKFGDDPERLRAAAQYVEDRR